MYLSKICPICGEPFFPSSGNQKRCEMCGPIIRKEYINQWATIHREQKNRVRNLNRQVHPEKDWNLVHPEQQRIMEKLWGIIHPEKVRENNRKQKAARRALGFIPLNEPFESCEGHHVDLLHVLYIPKMLHKSIKHNVFTGENMAVINELAYEWLGGVSS